MGQNLKNVEQERDLRHIVHSSGKIRNRNIQEYGGKQSKSNQILGMIKRNIKWKDKNSIIKLYKALHGTTQTRILCTSMVSTTAEKKIKKSLKKYREEPLNDRWI